MKKLSHLFCIFGILICTTAVGQTAEEGIKLFRYSRFQSAEKVFDSVLQQKPDQIIARYWLVNIYLQQNRLENAESVYAQIPVSQKSLPMSNVIAAGILLKKADTVHAKQLFEEALGNERKKDPAIQMAIAIYNVDIPEGNPVYAVSLLDEAMKKSKEKALLLSAKGDAYRKMFNGSEAFKNYQLAADLDKNDPVNYFKIGKIYQTQNNPEVFSQYYNDAIKADPSFGPVYFQLYYYYYYNDVNKAYGYLQKYIANSDTDIRNNYLLADLCYVSKKYNEAIAEAAKIILSENNHPKPRIYKLLAYCYDALNNFNQAETNMKEFLGREDDSNYAAKDFELMAKLSAKNLKPSEAVIWYQKAYQIQKDTAGKTDLVRKIIQYYKSQKKYADQAYWSDQLYKLKANLNNLDIFNWGVAYYNAGEYTAADTVFALYATRYPEQSFGYYWRAKCNAAIDTAMETGLAIPHYENLIKVGLKDSSNANTRKWLIQAYGYIAAYKVNKEKQYSDALNYYDKILELDPANNDAGKYKVILEKMIDTKQVDSPPRNQ